MDTIEYASKVWAITLLLSPAIFNLCLMLKMSPETWFNSDAMGLFFTMYIPVFFVSLFFSSLSMVLFWLLAGFLSVFNGNIYLKKTLLIIATMIGFLPLWHFMEYDSECIILVFPWLLVGTLSTFLYDWQPERD